MDEKSTEHVMRVLQAHTVALCALLSTHPDPQTLRTAFETIAAQTHAHSETLELLKRAIR